MGGGGLVGRGVGGGRTGGRGGLVGGGAGGRGGEVGGGAGGLGRSSDCLESIRGGALYWLPGTSSLEGGGRGLWYCGRSSLGGGRRVV